jgi:hypothetical protein
MDRVNKFHNNYLAAIYGIASKIPAAVAGIADRAEGREGIDKEVVHGGGSTANGTTGKQLPEWQGWGRYWRGGWAGCVTIH